MVDNKILNTAMSSAALAEVDGLSERVNATDTVLDDAEGGERCVQPIGLWLCSIWLAVCFVHRLRGKDAATPPRLGTKTDPLNSAARHHCLSFFFVVDAVASRAMPAKTRTRARTGKTGSVLPRKCERTKTCSCTTSATGNRSGFFFLFFFHHRVL